jgi:hypothetical protein
MCKEMGKSVKLMNRYCNWVLFNYKETLKILMELKLNKYKQYAKQEEIEFWKNLL